MRGGRTLVRGFTVPGERSPLTGVGSGAPLRWGLGRPPTAATRPGGFASLSGTVWVGVGWGSGGGSGRPGCRWIGVLCSCRWRSSGRGDMWVVGGLVGGGLCS